MKTKTVFLNNIYKRMKKISVFLFSCLVILFIVIYGINNIVIADESQEHVRSSSLHTVITEELDTERIDYVNDEGVITYAEDKHYATIIRKKKDHSVLEEYFDALGEPAEQIKGYYAILKEYNEVGQNYKNTYLGKNGDPVIIKDGFSSVLRTFNTNGYIETEMFYDTLGNPIETPLHAYGSFKEYNEKGRNIRIVYLDQNKEPTMCGLGFSILYRTHYEEGNSIGKVKDEFYYDLNNEPICLSLGQFGLRREYDEFGRESSFTYLDADGLPMMTNAGYATIKKTFYEDDSIKEKLYYDEKGNPIELPEGYYGFYINDGKKIFVDSKGNHIFNLKHYLHSHQYFVILACIVLVIIASSISRNLNILFLACYVIFIIYMTLLYRNVETERYNLLLFWSYKQFLANPNLRWEIIYNILLFIPMGAILYRITPRLRVLLAAILLSFIIESVQYFTGFGLCEFDDLFSNSIGALFGYVGSLGITKCVYERYILTLSNKTKNI